MMILAAIWVCAAPVLTANQTLHAQRDIVLGVKKLEDADPNYVHIIRHAAFWHSYLPLLLGVLVFLALLTAFAWITAANLDLPETQESFRTLCYAAAVLPAFSFIGFLYGGGKDCVIMIRRLRDSSATQKIPSSADAESPASLSQFSKALSPICESAEIEPANVPLTSPRTVVNPGRRSRRRRRTKR